MAWQSLFTDNFNRADGRLGANYVEFVGSQYLTIVSNVVRAATGTSWYGDYVTAGSFANNQYAKVKITTHGGYPLAVFVRTTGFTRYQFNVDSGFYCFVQRVDSGGAITSIGSAFTITQAEGYSVSIYITGTGIEVFREAVSVATRTDSTIASGSPGLGILRTAGRLDDFEAGDEVAAPASSFVHSIMRHHFIPPLIGR